MSYIRYTQKRQHSDGESESYVYHSGDKWGIITDGNIPVPDWVEVLANVVGRLDLDDETKTEVTAAVVDYYADDL